MRKFFEDIAVTICGAFTSLLTVLVVVLIEEYLHFNIFTFMIWFIFPAGALGCGILAALGYYLGSFYFNHKPSKMLLLNMVVIAAGTQFLIYWIQYVTMILDNGTRVSEVIPFGAFLDIILTKAKYSLARTHTEGFEVGSLGYLIGLVQFIGFMLGGIVAYFYLADSPMCKKCEKYFRKQGKMLTKMFPSVDDSKPYLSRILSVTSVDEAYVSYLKESCSSQAVKGSLAYDFQLKACPKCNRQIVIEKVRVYNGSEWNDLEKSKRVLFVPEGTSLSDLFK